MISILPFSIFLLSCATLSWIQKDKLENFGKFLEEEEIQNLSRGFSEFFIPFFFKGNLKAQTLINKLV